MKERGKLHPEHPMDSIKQFIFSGENNGVTSSLIKGPKSSVFRYHSYVSLMLNRTTGEAELIIITTSEDPKLSEGFAIPNKVTDLPIPDDFARFEPSNGENDGQADKKENGFLTFKKVPYVVLALGDTVDRQIVEEVAVLFSIKGIKPEAALMELKEQIKDSKTAFN